MASSFPRRSHFLAFNHVCCLTLANPLHSRLPETSVAEAEDGPSWMHSGSGVWWAIAPISGQVIKQLGLWSHFRDLPRRQRSNFREKKKKQLFLGLHPNVRIGSVPEHWKWWRDLGFVSHPNSQYVHCFPRMPLACGAEHWPPGVWNLTMSLVFV